MIKLSAEKLREWQDITDFGIARAINTSSGKMNEDPSHTVRLQGCIPGTPIYIAPEQWDVTRGEIESMTQ